MATLIESQLPDIRQITEALELTLKIASLESQSFLMVFAGWQVVRRRRLKARMNLRRIQTVLAHATMLNRVVDPNDLWTNELLDIQLEIKSLLKHIDTIMPEIACLSMQWLRHLLYRRITRELLELHHIFGSMRTLILEHDADCSPQLDGRFDSVDALISAIEKDAA